MAARTTRDEGRLARALGPYRVLRGNRNLDLVFAGQTISVIGNLLYTVALIVLVYDLTGSASAVALLTFIRLVPYAVFLPFSGALADRWDRKRLMIGADLTRALCMFGLIPLNGRATLPLAFVLVFVSASVSTLFRPALAATLPSLVGGEDLVQANALMSEIENVSSVLGPALGGLLVLLGDIQTAFLINGLTFVVSAATLALVRVAARQTDADGDEQEDGWLARTLGGFRFLLREDRGGLLSLAVASAAIGLCGGAFWPLTLLLSEHAFHLGGQGTGFLNAAYGVGGIVAGLLTGAIVSRYGNVPVFMVCSLATYGAFVLFGLSPAGVIAIAVIVLYGLADVVSEVSGVSALQGATPNALMARVLSAADSMTLWMTLLGSLLVGPVIAVLGPRAATVVFALASAAVFAAAIPRLRRLQPELDVRAFVQGERLFATLPPNLLAGLPSHLRLERFSPGATIVREGESGDRLYLVKSGEVEVLEGNGARPLATLEARDYFGEIALLRDIPRTATVRSRGPVELYSLDRAEFQRLLGAAPDLARVVTTTGAARLRSLRRVALIHG